MRSELISHRFSGHRKLVCLLLIQTASALCSSGGGPGVNEPSQKLVSDEAIPFTPSGFSQEGKVMRAAGHKSGHLKIRVWDSANGRPTACRLNVVGPDGNYYQPGTNYLTPYSLTGEWPKPGAWGNRQGKGPFRYIGHFFYATGTADVDVPPGKVRVEASKGFEFAPIVQTIEIGAGQTQSIDLVLVRTADASKLGYFGGDPHFHFPRRNEQDDKTMLDILCAEDLHFGVLLAYNEPMGPYSGSMEKLDSPQFRGLGQPSMRERDGYAIISGQEYRSTTYGHLLLYLRETLVFQQKSFNADKWPVYGEVAHEVQNSGGLAVHAHGGYAQEVYADAALSTINAVELLQFGVYRGMGLNDWYDILNTGYRLAITAASDWPACRYLGDCRTYVHSRSQPSFPDWLHGAVEGRSFVSTGPLLLLEIDGAGPGERLTKTGADPQTLKVSIKLRCEVTPVMQAQLIVNGVTVQGWAVPQEKQQGEWWSAEHSLKVNESCWIAARAYSTTRSGQPDAEAHTNPVYVYLNGRAPYRPESLETWLRRIEGQVAVHRHREFAEKASVISYFERARDALLRVHARGGLSADEEPRAFSELSSAQAKQINAQTTQSAKGETSVKASLSDPAAPADFPFDESEAELIGQRNLPDELKQSLAELATNPARERVREKWGRLLFAIGRGLKSSGGRLSAQDQFGPEVAQLLDEFRQIARRDALDERLAESLRITAIQELGCLTLERVHEPLTILLNAAQPQAIQSETIRVLSDFTDPLGTQILLSQWTQYSLVARNEVFQAMLRSEDRTLAFLRAVEKGDVQFTQANNSQRAALLSHRNKEVAALARKLFK